MGGNNQIYEGILEETFDYFSLNVSGMLFFIKENSIHRGLSVKANITSQILGLQNTSKK